MLLLPLRFDFLFHYYSHKVFPDSEQLRTVQGIHGGQEFDDLFAVEETRDSVSHPSMHSSLVLKQHAQFVPERPVCSVDARVDGCDTHGSGSRVSQLASTSTDHHRAVPARIFGRRCFCSKATLSIGGEIELGSTREGAIVYYAPAWPSWVVLQQEKQEQSIDRTHRTSDGAFSSGLPSDDGGEKPTVRETHHTWHVHGQGANNEEKVPEFMVVDVFGTDEMIVAADIEAATEDVTTPVVAVVPMTGASSPSTPSSNTHTTSSPSITNSPESYEGPVRFRSIADIYANTEEVVGIDEEEGEMMMVISEEPTCYQEAATEACYLEDLGFKKCTQEHAVYTRGEGEASILVRVYVDDLIVTGSSTKKINKFKQQMMTEFDMSDLGLLSYYLGIEVEQQKSQILLRQLAYAKKILSQFKMADYNATKHPIEPKT
ncbi:hypothetical protein ZIOFF_034888 [Zingiber officinale]|uniref:Reverse transcriptase Ty1/copia-type domain-containing protein n=1 Tax=Zingiber officinale TaxID=94328 RepID=A0A8J5GJ71_ZINOF|nr:hypothetical protein ZIOFF_034888 [Zingiber officinale]